MNNVNKNRGGCWSLDEKMGQTYIHHECANTLAARDFKQPQAVIYETDNEDRSIRTGKQRKRRSVADS